MQTIYANPLITIILIMLVIHVRMLYLGGDVTHIVGLPISSISYTVWNSELMKQQLTSLFSLQMYCSMFFVLLLFP